jgi:uncharacterized protein
MRDGSIYLPYGSNTIKQQINAAHFAPNFRGHHLICLHFYNGEGYGAEFIRHLSEILSIAESGDVNICAGADSICKACPHLRDGNCAYYENAEADIRNMDAKAFELLGLTPGTSISWKEVRKKVEKIFREWYCLYCKDCSWASACQKNESFRKLISKI